jgi:hypothetical protein
VYIWAFAICSLLVDCAYLDSYFKMEIVFLPHKNENRKYFLLKAWIAYFQGKLSLGTKY